jgi:hypothetical protein
MRGKTNDLIMKVRFCPKHKEWFDEKVTRLFDRKYATKDNPNGNLISPAHLSLLMKEAEVCPDCQWQTLFPSLKHYLDVRGRDGVEIISKQEGEK